MLADRKTDPVPLGDTPLLVIVRGLPDEEGPDAQRAEDEHKKDQIGLATLSRKGKYVIRDDQCFEQY